MQIVSYISQVVLLFKVLKDKVRLAHPEEEESPETQENATSGVQTNGVNHTNGVKTNGVNHTNGDNQGCIKSLIS